MDKTKDDAFRNFLEKIQGQNKTGLLLSTLQLKYERETAGEDADKREEQLEQLATAFENVEKAITGMSVKFDFKPVINALDNQTQVLQKSLEEQALLRKVSEGSLEYDKESAQYRNVSGRELTSDVSGKTVKQGAYVDFETAANRLQGQGKRVRESEQNQITFKTVELGKKTTVTGQPGDVTPRREKDEETTSFGNFRDLDKAVGARLKGIYDFMTNKVDKKEDVKAKPEITGINPESDNIQSTQEVMADSAKKDVELTAVNNDLLEQQLKELKKISTALAPSTPADLPEGRLKPTPGTATGEVDSGGGLGLGDALAGMGGLAKKAGGAVIKGAKVVGKGALSLGGGIAKFAASGAGKALGATAAVGLGAYTAYKGYTGAEEEKQKELEAIDAKIQTGELTPDQALEQKKEVAAKATENKGGALGKGTGMAAGAIGGGIAGAKVGATIGTFLGGPVGTAIGAGIGTLAGGAIGAFSGSEVGQNIGGAIGKGVAKVKSFFGAEDIGKKTKDAVTGQPAESKTTTSIQFSEMEFAKKDPDNYKKFVEFKGKRTEEIAKDQAKKFGKKEPSRIDYEIAETKAKVEAIKKFQKEIESSGAGKVETKSATLNKEQQAKTGSEPGVGKAGAVPEIGTGKTAVQPVQKPTTVTDTHTKIANERVVPGQPLSEKQMTVIGMSKSMGNSYSPEIEAQYNKQKQVAAVETKPSSNNTGPSVTQASTENSDLTREANMRQSAVQPIISSNVSNNNTQSFVPIKPSPRSERSGSALDRYNDRVSAY